MLTKISLNYVETSIKHIDNTTSPCYFQVVAVPVLLNLLLALILSSYFLELPLVDHCKSLHFRCTELSRPARSWAEGGALRALSSTARDTACGTTGQRTRDGM